MKLSAWVSVSDLLPEKKTRFDRFIFDRFIKQRIFSKNNPQDVLLALKKAGVEGLELLLSSNTKEEELQKIESMTKKLDMQIFSVHQPLSKLFNISIYEVSKLSQITNRLKAKVLVLHINVIGKQIFEKEYVKSLKELEKKYDIKIGIENSPKSALTIFNSYCWQEEEFSKLVIENNLNVTFDVTHVAQVGGNIFDFYKKNKSRIVNIHLSDYKKNFLNTRFLLTYDTHLPLGKGQLPIKDFLQTLKKNQYNGLITMEINGSLDHLCRSANFCLLHFKNSSDTINVEW